ncbi:MAG TPA: zinc ribbon domain-containing protein [Myxococcales bacterium]|nr:zinc ribbon domain-containing protein [Myxococcales bacterium]
MTKCCECSRVLADGASFCPFCGTVQTKDATPDDTTTSSSRQPTKRGKQTDAMERRQEIGRADAAVETHPSDESTLGSANTVIRGLPSKESAREHRASSERPTVVRHVPSEDSSPAVASRAPGKMIDTVPGLVGAKKMPQRSTQDIQGRNIPISPQRESDVDHRVSDDMTAPTIVNDLDATDHSGSGDYMSNLANSTQAIEMTQEMLDAMDQHAAQIQVSKEHLPHVDPGFEKTGSMDMEVSPELLTDHEEDASVTAPSLTEPSEAEETRSSDSGPHIAQDTVEPAVARMPESRSLTSNSPPAVKPSRVETPFDKAFEYVLTNKIWTIPVGIVVLVLALFLAESLR